MSVDPDNDRPVPSRPVTGSPIKESPIAAIPIDDNPRHRHPAWQWREGNSSELLIDGSAFYPAMLSAIEGARTQVLLEFYFVSSGQLMDRFIAALVAARARGVEVLLLLDGFGGYGLLTRDRERLARAGVRIGVYNPLRLSNWSRNFARDHRKLLLVDGEQAFIGGAGLADEFYLGAAGEPPWHELVLRLRGPVVADWQQLFFGLWRWVSGEITTHGPAVQECGDQRMRLATAAGPLQQQIKISFRRQVHHAERRVWMVTAYFLPSWSVRRALRRAARRGVDVRLLLPGPYTDHPWLYQAAQRYYRQLLVAGVRIYEYQPRFIHAKVSLCDDWVSLGSCNMDRWNLRWNLEANQEVDDPVLARQIAAAVSADLNQSREITLAYWQSRPRLHRALRFLIGYVSALLLRMIR